MLETNLNSEFNSIPVETRIYYSKVKAWVQIFLMIIFISYAIVLCIKSHGTTDPVMILVLIVGSIASYLGYTGFSHIINSNPQIIINENGIETVNTPFVNWADITNDRVIRVQDGKKVNYLLEYEVPYASESVDITNLSINNTQLENLLHAYRARSEKGKK